jgi:hypothetical protein
MELPRRRAALHGLWALMALWMMPAEYKSLADERDEKRKKSKTDERDIYAAVDKRDGMICRACGCHMVRSMERNQKRREHHHILPRSQGGKTTTGNIVNVCHADHERLTRHLLTVEGSADGPLTFAMEGRAAWISKVPK